MVAYSTSVTLNRDEGKFMTEQYNEELRVLIGRQLTAVTFIMDYVKFQFEDAFLSSLYPPVLSLADGSEIEFGMDGFCNRVRERIQQTVAATEDNGREIIIKLEDGSVIRVPLWYEEARGSEAAILECPPEPMLVWRPE
jgi:hypothetical protein